MPHSVIHTSTGRLALSIVLAAAMLLLASSARASSESTAAEAAPSEATTESIAAVATTPPPATTATAPEPPEPADSPTPAEVVEDVSHTVSGSLPSNAAPPEAEEPAAHEAPVHVDPEVVSSSVSSVSSLAGQIHRDASKAIAPVAKSAGTVASTAKATGESIGRTAPVDGARRLGRHVLQTAGEALHRGPLGLVAPDTVGDLLPPAGVGVGTSSRGPASKAPNTPASGAQPGVRVTILNGPPPQLPAGRGGVEALQLEAAGAAHPDLAAANANAWTQAETGAGASFDDVGNRAESLASLPPDGNVPTPFHDLPPTAASGSGGSTSVPIAPLLALLALAAPAIFRRLREVPELTAPAPFVCALERPG